MAPVLLNMDVGELPDESEEFYELAHLVHVAATGHAGDRQSIARAIGLARRGNVQLGAHPSYPDRENFGRKVMVLKGQALFDSLSEQLSTFAEVAREQGCPVVSVKAHGALYHELACVSELAEAFVDAVQWTWGTAVKIVGAPQGELESIARTRGFQYWSEGFVDRAKAEDGTLLPRSHPGALITDPDQCVSEALKLARSGKFQTLCIHGDTPGALSVARAVRKALDQYAGDRG